MNQFKYVSIKNESVSPFNDLHFDDFFHNIEFQRAVKNASLNNNIVVSKWNQCIDLVKEFKGQLVEFTRQ